MYANGKVVAGIDLCGAILAVSWTLVVILLLKGALIGGVECA